MQTCINCGKQFATVPQLRGHNMRCRTPKMEVTESTPLQQGANQEVKKVEEIKVVKEAKYKELPKPIVEFLEREIPNWLDKFEIGQVWKQDFGGYGMYIKVPREFSIEHFEENRVVYDNRTRRAKVDSEGNEVLNHVVTEDVRWKPIREIPDTIKWIELVIKHILEKAQQKGLQLPVTRIE